MTRQQTKAERTRIVVGSLCYIFYEQQVLLLKRSNPPHRGLWTAPGGKMEFGESPQECCLREVHEETGFHIMMPELCAIQTVIDIAIPIHWQLFIFRARLNQKLSPQHQPDHHEGEFCWFALDELSAIHRPYTDQQHWAHVISNEVTIWQSKFVYDTPQKLVDEQNYRYGNA